VHGPFIMGLNGPRPYDPMVKTQTLAISDWLLTETIRLREEHIGRSRDDEAANALARTTPGSLADRLATRARALPAAVAIHDDIGHLYRLLQKLVLVILLFAATAGLLAARASIAQREVDILLAAATLLAFPTLMLITWMALMRPGRHRGGSGSLVGHLLRRALGWLGPRLLSGDHAVEVTVAGGSALGTPFGRWLLSALAHAFWTVYLLSSMGLLTFFFAVAQYDLTWGTTLLTDEQVVSVVGVLAAPPAWLGLIPEPQAGWILSGREGALAPEARALWARFLLALVFVYGLLPRLALLAGCSVLAWSKRRRLPLDTAQPGYLRLSGILRPDKPRVTEYGKAPKSTPPRRRMPPSNTSGHPILVGLELERDDWPPIMPGIETSAIGQADARTGRKAVLAALSVLPAPPPLLLIACSLLRTPDSAHARFIDQAADRAGTIPVLLLLDADRLAERGDRLASRLADWQALAEQVGGVAMRYDPDAPDAATLARLKRMMDGVFE
jgi:hypothetical protein